MAYNRLMSELDGTKTQLAVLIVSLFLLLDSINPMKLFLHVFSPLIGVTTMHLITIILGLLAYLFVSEFREMLYFGVKVFFHSILSIFFSSIETTGLQNIPIDGPAIFVGNHANQFVDGIMLMSTCQHKVSFLVAEKSWNRRVIGDFAWAMGAVPVSRSQDSAEEGKGSLTITKVRGDESKNPKVKVEGSQGVNVGDKIRLKVDTSVMIKLVSDEEGEKVGEVASEHLETALKGGKYDILKRVDQSQVYAKVLSKLEKGGCIGIFPEGGSHDRTDLLPLKVGVALIAYAALEKRGLNIPIIPVGLNYFSSHRFRGRCVVEFGAAINIDEATLPEYLAGGERKKAVCSGLLKDIQDGMRSVIVTAPDYDVLKHIHTARRLWKRTAGAQEKQDLNRRFALGLQKLLLKFDQKPPKKLELFMNELKVYQKTLDELGIKDYQVPTLVSEGTGEDTSIPERMLRSASMTLESEEAEEILEDIKVPYRIAHLLFTIFVAAIPSIFLNLPIGLLSNLYAEKKRKKALAASKVKIKGMDVLLSEKVMFCIVMVPTLWLFYLFLLLFLTNLEYEAIALFFVSMPIAAYAGIMVTESGMVDYKDIKPWLMKLHPATRKRLRQLPKKRMVLVNQLREFVSQWGPELGEIYYEQDVDWKKVQGQTASVSPPQSPKKGDEKKKQK
ncbi:hypothetical protein TrLO_g3777 [Triparma laevis f. longispina]|uniref:Phospholipid/glycerol acyltransferase domain-containing protein n=1 Tax=Triparma laevis f. longispina TaxID=1714387 RepID=A0A9W7KZ55_9STRA|nr:hypothetical protein TrLO_g3777 [Triparma laevis f. longispina]